jgi:iron complex outermembrane receptor protein
VVRTPSPTEHDLSLTALADPTGPTFFRVLGSRGFRSENTVSAELGVRSDALERLQVGAAGFYNWYSDLLSLEAGAPFAESGAGGPRTIVPLTIGNGFDADIYGAEAWGRYRMLGRVQLRATAAFLRIDFRRRPGSNDALTEASSEGSSPRFRGSLWASVDLPWDLELDGLVRRVGALPAQGVAAFWELNARLAYVPSDKLELAVVGQNLLKAHHQEFGSSPVAPSVERTVFGKLVWRW